MALRGDYRPRPSSTTSEPDIRFRRILAVWLAPGVACQLCMSPVAQQLRCNETTGVGGLR